MDLVVRAVTAQDREAVHEILGSPHVLAGTMRVPFSPRSETERRLNAAPGTYQLAAEADGQVVGFGELVTHPDQPRHRHSGEINLIATHADWLRRGVARAIMAAMLELADSYLNLSRLSLIAFSANTAVLGFYETFGFRAEGTMRQFGYGPDGWIDAVMMGRLREPTP